MLRHGRVARWLSSSSILRSDAYAEQLQRDLPVLYNESLQQFAPTWARIASVVAATSPTPPRRILDLASGGVAEPAVTLAKQWRSANVVASDVNARLCAQANARVNALGLGDHVEVQQIDLAAIALYGKAEDGSSDGEDDPPSVDVITCSLGLYMLPPVQHRSLFKGIAKLLPPGGRLIATVWDRMGLLEVGQHVLHRALGQSPQLPYDPTSLGQSAADDMSAEAGLEPLMPLHGSVGSVPLNLGPVGSERAWMLGLLPYTGMLLELHRARPSDDVLARVVDAFHEEVSRQAEGKDGLLECDAETREVRVRGLDYRVIAVRKH